MGPDPPSTRARWEEGGRYVVAKGEGNRHLASPLAKLLPPE